VDLSLQNMANSISMFRQNKNINSDWIPDATTALGTSGAGGKSSYGRLALWANFGAVKSKILQLNQSASGFDAVYIVGSLTGGTGLYIDAICKGIDIMPDPEPEIRTALNKEFQEKGIESLREKLKRLDSEYYKIVDLNNPARLIRALEICQQTGLPYSSFRKTQAKQRDFQTIKIALNVDREVLYERINKRVDLMVKAGLIEEAKALYAYKDLTALKTVGYQELFAAFDGEYSISEAIIRIKNSSRKYARKQISWLRRDSDYRWFMPNQTNEIVDYINKRMQL
jgi:tRNA dimethylallyltransferase